MEPDNIRFGGGPSASVLHPLVAIAMLVAIILILCLPRKYVIFPALLAIFIIPKGQQIVLAGIHLNVYRIMILAGLARWVISARSSPLAGGFNFMDKICTVYFLSYYVTDSLLYSLQIQPFIKNTGDLLDVFGGYFVLRFLIHDRDDIRRTIKALATIAIVNAICMLYEQHTNTNLFAFLGGVPDEVFRDGKLRSQGTFESFLTAGTFGATLMPLLVVLWSQAKSRTMTILGMISATIMAITCYASTTLVGYAAGIFALCFWPFRNRMRLVRWGIVITLVFLHLVMHGPVWSLLEHIDLTGSSSSYHRFMLIDTFIKHFSDWWLVGTKDNGNWGFDMWDASNEYVLVGFAGGLSAFLLFVTIISKGFSKLGTARKLAEGTPGEEWFYWCIGAALFSHVVSFFGTNYMDQMMFAWLTLLAIIAAAVSGTTVPAVAMVEDPLTSSYEIHAARS